MARDAPPTVDQAVKRLITFLRAEKDPVRALRKTLVALLGVLQSPHAYEASKTHKPLSAFNDFVHKLFLTYAPLSKLFERSYSLAFDRSVRASRTLDDGQFAVVWPATFLPSPPTEEDYKLYPYEVCISFANEQRSVARSFAMTMKKDFSLKVFYDDFAKLELWGKDLFNHLYDVYSEKARYCVLLLSKEYFAKNWTNHELRAAQSRVLRDRRDYIFPIMMEPDILLPKPFDTFSYVRYTPQIVKKLSHQIHHRFFEEIKDNMLSEKELTQALNDDFLFQISIDPFLKEAQVSPSEEDSLRILIVGLIWSIRGDHVKVTVRALFEYLLFLFPPIAAKFDDKGMLALIPPDGELYRVAGSPDGPLFIREAFMNRVIKEAKDTHPWFGSGKTATRQKGRRRNVVRHHRATERRDEAG